MIGFDAAMRRLRQLPANIEKRVTRNAIRKTGRKLLRTMKAAAPRSNMPKQGKQLPLRKCLGISFSRKQPVVWVGIKKQFYYKTLDLHSARGAALHPWFKQVWQQQEPHITALLVEQIKLDIAREAGKHYARSRV